MRITILHKGLSTDRFFVSINFIDGFVFVSCCVEGKNNR